MAVSPEAAHLRAVRACAISKGQFDKAETAGRDLRAVLLRDHIRKVIAQAPPLTPEQLDSLAAMLRPATDDVVAS